MNKLILLKNMGFKISWKLITIGLFGNDEIPPLLTRDDLVEYLYSLLIDTNDQTDNIVTLICEEDNLTNFENTLKKLADEDVSDIAIQKRKWRAFLLKNLMDNISCDCLQGLLELMEFWLLMKKPNDCPQIFPSNDNKKSVQDYFTQASYEFNLKMNRSWLDKEIATIIDLEV